MDFFFKKILLLLSHSCHYSFQCLLSLSWTWSQPFFWGLSVSSLEMMGLLKYLLNLHFHLSSFFLKLDFLKRLFLYSLCKFFLNSGIRESVFIKLFLSMLCYLKSFLDIIFYYFSHLLTCHFWISQLLYKSNYFAFSW